ncbi:MAG: glycosyltransferase family 4 protein, partial [Propionibacterium sp.]|nr:glycosyltransferase family 4 protein [Propionibacterium sp.]
TFTGRVDKQEIAEHLSRAHIGVCPDLKTPLNDLSTMNKSLEYMAYALPSVAFDLKETQVTGGEAIRYVDSGDIAAMADEVETLIDDDDLRVRLSRLARERVVELFDWAGQAQVFGDVFDQVLGLDPVEPDRTREAGECDEWGRQYVPLEDDGEYGRFLERRSR